MFKAYKLMLDPNEEQVEKFAMFSGASRWAYNYALARKVGAHKLRRELTDIWTEVGYSDTEIKAMLKRRGGAIVMPNHMANATHWRHVDREQVSPWWREVYNDVFSYGFQDADTAFKNWFDSLSGKRKGLASGYPRFKSKGRAKDSFTIGNKAPRMDSLRFDDYRHIRIPGVGSVRLEQNGRRVARKVARGAVIKRVTVSRGANRWYVSVLLDEADVVARVSKRATGNGYVGVDPGVAKLVTLSNGLYVENPRYLKASEDSLRRAQRDASRKKKGSNGQKKAFARVAKIHHKVALQRAAYLHQLSHDLTTDYAGLVIEDTRISNMTRSAKGTVENPGKGVKAKSGLNRSVLDSGWGTLYTQLEYKSAWTGCDVQRVPAPYTSMRCSQCGFIVEGSRESQAIYRCKGCGWNGNADHNAAMNILQSLVRSDGGGDEILSSMKPEGLKLGHRKRVISYGIL